MRGDNDYPVTIASTLHQRRAVRAATARWRRASRRSSGPTRARAACRSIARPPCTRRRSATSIAARSTPGTSRSSAGCRSTSRWTWPTSARRASADTPRSTSTRRRRSASATRAGRIASLGPLQSPINSWGQRLKTRVQLAAGRAQQAVHARAAVQGRLHAQQGDERERQRRPGDARPGTRRASSAATGRPRASTAGTTSSSASPMRCRGRAAAATTTSLKAIVSDWQLNGVFAAFSGTPFTVTASGTSLNTPSNHADRRPGRRRSTSTGNIGAGRRVVRHGRVRAADRRPVRQHGPQPVLRSRRLQPRLLGVPHRSRSAARKRLELRRRGRQHPEPRGVRQPAGQHHVRHVRPDHRHQRQLIRERMIRLGLRFSF